MGLLTEVAKAGGSKEVAAGNNRGRICKEAAALFSESECLRDYEELEKHVQEGNENDSYRAAISALMIHRTDQYMKNCMEMYGKDKTESVIANNLGALPKRVLDVVRIFYPNQIAQDICDIQPIDGEVGQIFTMTPVFSNTIAGVTAQTSNLFTTQPTNNNYASEYFSDSLGTGNGSAVTFAITATYTSLRAGTVTVTAGTVTGADDGNGNITGTGISAGTVNYTTGAISVTFSSAPALSVALSTTYLWNSETLDSSIRQIEFNIGLQPVQAQIHPLTFRYSVRAGLAAQAHLAVDVQDTLAQTAAQYIKIERDNKLVSLITAAAPADSNMNFNASTSGLNYDKRSFYGELELKLNYAESKIQTTNGRGGVDFVLCGVNVADIMRNARGFKPAAVVAPIGAHVIGWLRDGTVAVIKSLNMSANSYVVGYKGYMAGDSATILAEWIPIYFTPTFQAPTMYNQQGVMSMYDMFVNRANYYLQGTISSYGA